METAQDYLKECVVDIPRRTFTLISDKSETLELVCDEIDQFQRVLELVRATCNFNEVSYKY
tara:strand:- start:275 stop:457 length:183 start_codon:yes stop_codon:yes gene_type:complete